MRAATATAATTVTTTTTDTVKVPKFVRSLYDILHYEDNAILGWSADGTYFQVHDVPRLEREVLHKYFKHSKFTSFQRQLNNFNFHKWTKTRANVCTFSHDALVRCHPNQLSAMVAAAFASSKTAAATASPLRAGTKRQRCESETDVALAPIGSIFTDMTDVVETACEASPKRHCIEPIRDMDIDRIFEELTATGSPLLLLDAADVSDLLKFDWTQTAIVSAATADTSDDTSSGNHDSSNANGFTADSNNSDDLLFLLPEDTLLFEREAAVRDNGDGQDTKLAIDSDALATLIEETSSIANIVAITRSISIVSSSSSSDGEDVLFSIDDVVLLQLEFEDDADWTTPATTITL